MINTAAIDLTVFDTDHRYLFINENAVKDTEIRHWLIGKTDFDYCALRGLDTSLAVRRREKFTECIQTRKTVELEEKFVNQHGEAHYSIKRFKPIVYKDEVRYVIGFGLDITELKVYENYLEQSEKKYRDLFESSLDLIQSVDTNGKILFFNKAWEERMGYSKEEIENINLFDIIADEDKEHCTELFQRVLLGESHHGIRVSFITKGGNPIVTGKQIGRAHV